MIKLVKESDAAAERRSNRSKMPTGARVGCGDQEVVAKARERNAEVAISKRGRPYNENDSSFQRSQMPSQI